MPGDPRVSVEHAAPKGRKDAAVAPESRGEDVNFIYILREEKVVPLANSDACCGGKLLFSFIYAYFFFYCLLNAILEIPPPVPRSAAHLLLRALPRLAVRGSVPQAKGGHVLPEG